MASPAVLPSLLQALPPRPPTPPRETIAETEIQHRQLLASSTLQPTSSSLHTPPGAHSPGSGISSSRRKKVGFSAKAEYQDPPIYLDGEIKRVPTPISLPSSNSKPIKSILKITYGPNPLVPDTDSADSTGPNANLGIMLDSSIQHLAGADRDSRVDAYMMLIRALRASNNLPDRVALQEKMSLFMQFIQRDVTAKTSTGVTDWSLVNQSLNLLVTFLNFPAIASTLTNDFAIFMVDHCIRSFEDPSTSKEVVRHLMQVIAVQRFSTAKVMTLDRVGRLVSSLHKIEEHLKGKSIIMARLHIYKKLVTQCKQAMVVHSDWLLDLFTDMLSELRDIRVYAINLGLEAGFSIGRERSISRKTMEIFNQSNEEKKYIEFYQERLLAMIKDKNDIGTVPQIWSVVILLLRCPVDRWSQMSHWLKIIQHCFNSSDVKPKIEANAAWCRLAYLMLMDERSSQKALSILNQPLKSQLRRKEIPGKQAEEFRQSVIGGVRYVLYYTFKPHANLVLLDSHWDNCVKDLLTQMLSPTTPDAYNGTHHATAILAGLFDCTTPRVWKDERVTEKGLMQADELPAIDPKWLRRNAARVFELVEPIMLKNITELNNIGCPTYKLWRNLVTAVASAAAKEIKVSLDTTQFVAHALNLLQKIWKQGRPRGAGTGQGFLTAIQAYVTIMIESLGLLPFTEKQLSLDNQHRFVPLATPTHRLNKAQGSRTPLKHLFSFLSTVPDNIQDDESFRQFFSTVFSPFVATKSDKGRMDLAQDLLSTIPMEAMMPYGPWTFVADNVSRWLDAGHSSVQTTGSGAETPIGHEYREIVRILERGLRSTPALPWQHWQSFFKTVINRIRDETGEAGVAIVVIEPLAKVVLDLCSVEDSAFPSDVVQWITELISAAVQPRDRQAVDAARRRLWGSGPLRVASFDTFENLYKATNLVLQHTYKIQASDERAVPALLTEVGNFLERCNPQLVAKSLLALQEGLAPWIQDQQAETYHQPQEVKEAMKSTWQKVCTVLAGYDRSQQLQLDSLQPLLCAAFESKHLRVVNSATELWNHVFEDVEEIQYPEKLKAVLQSLRKKVAVDIHLPGLEDSSLDSTDQEAFFVESQEEIQLPQLQSTKSSKRSTPRPSSRPSSRPNSQPASAHRNSSPAVKVSGHVSKKRSLDVTPHERLAKVQKRNKTTPKLRHDDSQIQFAAVEESSPVLQENLESQALTDRQKEVRERQKETAVVFKEIRSSPSRKTKPSSRPSSARRSSPQSQLPAIRRAATPEPTRSLEDYVSSTPTPRRGLATALPYQDSDMADPPSSPPEPRRNPLLREIQSRSAEKTLMDDWQFSSSPVGSPVAPRHEAGHEQQSQMDLDDIVMGSDDEVDLPNDSHDQLEPELGESAALERIVEDSVIMDKPTSTADDSVLANASESIIGETAPGELVAEVPAKNIVKSKANIVEDPSTPTHNRTISTLEETPQLPSPAVAEPPSSSQTSRTTRSQRTPRQPTRASSRASSASARPTRCSARKAVSTAGSFEASDVNDSSLLRLVVELDGHVNSQEYEYRQVTDSPEKKRIRQLTATPEHRRIQSKAQSQAQDCIIVSSPFKPADDEVASSSIPETIPEESEVVESSQVSQTSSRGRRKRKRGNSAALAAARKRKSLRGKSAEIKEDDEENQAPATQESVDLSMSQPGPAISFSSVPESESQLSKLSQVSQVDDDNVVPPIEEQVAEDVELEIESQLAEESAQGSRRQTQEPEAMEVESAAELPENMEKEVEEPMEDAHFETAKEAPAEQVEETSAESMEVEPVQEAAEETTAQQPETPFQKIMGFFRGGLEALKSATLSRSETLQVEDMFMDVRRELIEAELRGRAPPS